MNTKPANQDRTVGVFVSVCVLLAGAIFSVSFLYYKNYPQETLYFISVLSTVAVTGFLAFYAWVQRNVVGALAFMWMEICECCLGLAEILSMVSGTPAQALFWFNLRFLFIAIIPVIWVGFALTYGEYRKLVSRKLFAFALVIPLVTQVMVWSNGLHGLWLKHEVGFHQVGPFWIVDISARIPGPWFMVHSFYSLLLLLAGIGVIFLIAWRVRRGRVQALLLFAGGLVGLITSVIPVFNLLPQEKFNLFIPGIGVSALLYALAVFRFQFLKRSPAVESNSRMADQEMQSARSAMLFAFVFVLMATAMASIAYISYKNYERQFSSQVERQLSAIAGLKVNELDDIRKGWLADGKILSDNAAFAALVQNYFENPQDLQLQTEIQDWLDNYHVYGQYDRVRLLDMQGDTRLSAPEDLPPLAPLIHGHLPEVLQSGQVTIVDFYRDDTDQRVYLTVLVPILNAASGNHTIGFVTYRINPEVYLYPYISQWPADSETAETLLIRREGNDVLYLNNIKFEENAALNLHIPLEKTEVPAVRAILGKTGIVEGVDYRGVPVLADIRVVPDSPWFLVAKVDIAEVYAPLRTRAWETLIFFCVLGIGAGTILGVLWREQRLRFFRAQHEKDEALRKSETQYRELIEHASDGIFIADANGKYIEVNSSGYTMLGYTREEILTKRISDMIPPEDVTSTPLRLDDLKHGKTLLVERRLICKDGSLLPVEISGNMLPDGFIQFIIRDISERKQAEDALKKSEKKYRRLHESMMDGFVSVDMDGKFLECNEIYRNMLGYSEAELAQLRYVDLTPEKWHAYEADVVENQIIKRGYSDIYEKEYRRKDGTIFPVELHTVLSRDEHGNPTNMWAIARDITERKRIEEALRESEEKYRSLFQNAQAGMYRSKLDGSAILDVNRKLCEIFGYSEEEMIGNPATIRWADPAARNQMAAELRRTGSLHDYEMRILTKNGEVRTLLISSSLNSELGYLEGSGVDITERKQAEEKIRKLNAELEQRVIERTAQLQTANTHLESELAERKRVEDALRESEERSRRLSDAAFEAIIIHDKGILLSANNQYCEMFGYAPEELLGKQVMSLTIAPDSIETVQKEIAAGGLGPYEAIGQKKDGTRFPMEIRVRGTEYQGRKVRVAAIMDITERKRAGEALQQRTAQLEAANKELEAFSYSVSHDLRAPLRAVTGYANILVEDYGPSLDAEGKRVCSVINDEAQRMGQLIDDLLTFSRLGRKEMRNSRIDIQALVQTIFDELTTPDSRERIDLQVGNLPSVIGDPALIRQVWVNLLSNALKFTSKKERAVIEVGSTQSTEETIYFVRDNGAGFDMQYADKLFGVFQRLHSESEFEGTGVGLAVVQRVILRHGGRVWGKGEVDKGAEFCFALPGKEEPHE
jgi:PAS domain S-box-containing protein